MTWGVTGLTVSFGSRVAIREVDLELEPGSVTAVVGGDGAGKTTLLRALAGLLTPDLGSVSAPDAGEIGYVPASGGAFRDLTVNENLQFAAGAHRLPNPLERAAPLLERTGLAPFGDRLAGDLSGGMRRKLAAVTALLHEPLLLILDEPTTGIDPVSRSDLWRLIAAAATRGAAVAVASAYLDEADRAASVLILHDGRPVVAGTPDQVRASMPGAVLDTAHPTNPARAWRRGSAWREWLPDGADYARPPDLEDVAIVAALAEAEAGQ